MQQLQNHTLGIAIARPSTTVDINQLQLEVLYDQQPRLVASRRLAAQLGRRLLKWRQLAKLDCVLGAPGTPIREQTSDIFLQPAVAPPSPTIESHANKTMGNLIASSNTPVPIL